ncbi:MAG: hypothetical protein QXH65_06785 [Thermofilaceae archaeon]
MPIYLALREPGGSEARNLLCLREAARLKGSLIGVYYNPQLRRLLAVFKVPPDARLDESVFERVDPSVIEASYRMECPKGCGRCCAVFSGAFVLDVEIRKLPSEVRQRIEAQPSRLVETVRGLVRVYELGTGPAGRCIFFNVKQRSCQLESYGRSCKPIICLLTYCTIFASRSGRLYLKVRAREVHGRYEMIYREATEEEWRRAIESLTRTVKRAMARKEGPS